MDYVLYKNIDDKYLTLEDCVEENRKPAEGEAETGAEGEAKSGKKLRKEQRPETEKKQPTRTRKTTARKAEEKEKEKVTVYYVTDPVQQSQYINLFRQSGAWTR